MTGGSLEGKSETSTPCRTPCASGTTPSSSCTLYRRQAKGTRTTQGLYLLTTPPGNELDYTNQEHKIIIYWYIYAVTKNQSVYVRIYLVLTLLVVVYISSSSCLLLCCCSMLHSIRVLINTNKHQVGPTINPWYSLVLYCCSRTTVWARQ